MDILVAFIIGAFSGIAITLFVVGASIGTRENEAFMEGYLDGQKDKEVKK